MLTICSEAMLLERKINLAKVVQIDVIVHRLGQIASATRDCVRIAFGEA